MYFAVLGKMRDIIVNQFKFVSKAFALIRWAEEANARANNNPQSEKWTNEEKRRMARNKKKEKVGKTTDKKKNQKTNFYSSVFGFVVERVGYEPSSNQQRKR